MYDYIIVGAGLFGSVFAHEMHKLGYKCMILEKRNHIGGNCYSEIIENIEVHVYGPHVFHTNNKQIWEYINKFSEFNNYRHVLKHIYKGKVLSFPINMMTFHQLWGVITPQEASKKLDEVRIKNNTPSNFEEWALSQIGHELYEIFIKGYTIKQWKRDPKNLPSEILKRIPIRMIFDDSYFNDTYQGIPVEGYTGIFKKLVSGIRVELGVDYIQNRRYWDSQAKNIIFTGKIDEFFDYKLGKLEYLKTRFDTKILSIDNFQGCSVINYSDINIPYTRVTEHKHFKHQISQNTVITYEFPEIDKGVLTHPVNDDANNNLYMKYKNMDSGKVIFGGRLGEYKYYDMDKVIESALNLVKKEITRMRR